MASIQNEKFDVKHGGNLVLGFQIASLTSTSDYYQIPNPLSNDYLYF